MKRSPPNPPHPDLIRRPQGGFGWIEDRLLRESWLADMGPEAAAVMVLLAVAADRHGASFYSRSKMAIALGIDRGALDLALQRLMDLGLVAHRPWKPDHRDGVWQLLPVPSRKGNPERENRVASVAEILKRLGLHPKP